MSAKVHISGITSHRRHLTIKSVLLCFALFLFTGAATPTNDLIGDKQAIALVNSLLESIGGKENWKNASYIKVELTGYYAREKNPWEELYWMDLRKPQGKFILKRANKVQTIAWTELWGWDEDNGVVHPMDSARHAFELAYWEIQPLVLFRRLAAGFPKTRVEMGDNKYRFDVFDVKSERLLAQFAVNEKGEPIKWGGKIGDREFEHIFGPLESFNSIAFPKWGANLSGVWRYEHKSIRILKNDPKIDFNAPNKKE